MDPMSKSVNTSATDFLGDSLPDSASRHSPPERGESQLPPMGEALQAEKLGGDPPEEIHTSEHLTVTTEGPVAAHMATAGPTTAGDSRDGGGRSEGGSREGGEKVPKDNRTVSTIMTKDSTRVGAPVTPVDEDGWGIPVKTKKKASTSASPPSIFCNPGTCGKKKEEGANVGTPVVPSTGGGVVNGAQTKKKNE
jgi:hypothetical protein